MPFAPLAVDFYKPSHKPMYIQGTNLIHSNFTPRSTKRFKGSRFYDKKVVSFGYQIFVKDYLIKEWNETFFDRPLKEAVARYKRFMDNTLGKDAVDCSAIEALHKVGYLPIRLKALPEGVRYPVGVPCLTISNTLPEFGWITNYVESVLSAELWKPMTNATIAYEYRRVFEHYADLTGASKELIQFQAHDFSFRGMSGRHDAKRSGLAHLTSFVGTDTCPAIEAAEEWYCADIQTELVGTSVPATEHSVMCSGIEYIKQQFDAQGYVELPTSTGAVTLPMSQFQFNETHTDTQKLAELALFHYLMTVVYPTGILSIVSDSFDFWYMMKYGIEVLKDTIQTRDGKIVFRPDSGDPVDIICGTAWTQFVILDSVDTNDGTYYKKEEAYTVEEKGAMQCLYEVFGSEINGKGYKSLNSKVGLIYGDSITIERAETILSKLKARGYSTDCIVLGIGSYTYQYSTRDTLGFAMKATYTEVDGKGYAIYKDPKTSDGTKKSAKGLIAVQLVDGEYILKDNVSKAEEASTRHNSLEEIFVNGKLIRETSLQQIRKRLWPQ